jgi:endonuclease-3
VLLIEHGRKTCRARNPKCDVCVLQDICRYYKEMKQTQ